MNKDRRPKNPAREIKEFDEEVIQIDRVTRVVKGGRRLRFRATVVIGNHKGKVGVGIGKSTEVTGAISKAIAQAKKSLITVPMAGSTIPHRVQVKFKSARLLMMPANPGTGIKAGGSVRKVVELAGIKDIFSKCLGTTNRLNNSQAAIKALAMMKSLPWEKVQKATAQYMIVAEAAQADRAEKSEKRGFGGKKPFGKKFSRGPEESHSASTPSPALTPTLAEAVQTAPAETSVEAPLATSVDAPIETPTKSSEEQQSLL